MSSAISQPRPDDDPQGTPLDLGQASRSAVQNTPPDDRTVISKRPPLPLGKLPASPLLLGSDLVGQQLEHYELTEFVGGGGMGAVFRATDTRLGRTVAVKVLSRDHTDEETIRRFRNEAQNAARLDHPNIARVYYVGEDRGWNFIVFEFIEGINLRDLVDRDGPLNFEQALHYTLQVAEALDHASSRDIVHRDIKPSNVLVAATGEVKLVDMGLARLHQVESGADELTASGVTLGTFDYISPEQARDPRAADVRSDIYSLGCTLYFMLTGQPPFPEGTALQKLLRHNSDDPPDIQQFRPDVHPRISDILSRMLAKRPSQREQSPGELIAEIVSVGQQLGYRSIAEFHHVPVLLGPPPGQWRGPLVQIAAALGLFIAAVVVMEFALAPSRAGGDIVLEPRFKEPPAAQAPADVEAEIPPPKLQLPGISEPLDPDILPLSQSPGLARSPTEPPSTNSAAPLSDASVGRSNSASSPAAPLTTLPAEALATPEQVQAVAEPLTTQQIIVIGDHPAPPEPQTEYFETLAQAASRAAELNLPEIELRFSGPLVQAPLELANQRLTIRAAADHQPVIAFRPEVGLASRQMIRLAGGASAHLEFVGAELRLELPADPPSDGWALFAMSTGQSLLLDQCVLTVVDGDLEQLPVHDQVAMISVSRRRAADAMSMTDPQLAMGQQARVTLERSIARGEASLVHMSDETPLTIRWNQGLLATSKHLIETGGSSSEPQYYEQIVLDLDHVTAVARQGLYRLRRGQGKTYQFHVNSYANHCVFVADAGAPLFEMIGLSAPPETDELQSTGDGNRFSPVDMPFLYVRQTSSSEPFISKLGRRWSTETRPQAGVPWLEPPPFDQPAHDMTKHDFVISTDQGEELAGCDPNLLPEIWQPEVALPPSPSDEFSNVPGILQPPRRE
jgi:serine/threonine protein kinase